MLFQQELLEKKHVENKTGVTEPQTHTLI